MKIFVLLSLFLLTQLFSITLTSKLDNNSLIVYNSNVGLVHETRSLHVPANESKIIYEGVASSINTDSVNISLPKNISLLSQQYRFDKLTQNKLLNAHIGKSVSVKVEQSSTKPYLIKAKLLANNGATCIVQSNGTVITVPSDALEFTSIPKALITKPSLVWNIQTKKNTKGNMSLDYLIDNIKWKSDYILNLDGDEASLTGWITIDNRSGKSFQNTKLHVLAGAINRARHMPVRQHKEMVMRSYDSAPQTTRQSHEGYHFYTVPFKVNLANNEKTQIKFISEDAIAITRKYTVMMGNPNYLHNQRKHSISQHISMKGFTFPLPKGIVRTYSKLQDTSILLGENHVNHTPRDTAISLKLGKNFDIKATETLLQRDKGNWSLDVDARYSIKNDSDETKKIQVTIPFNKNKGSEVKSKLKYTLTKGNLITFNLRVQAHTTKTFEVYFTSKVNK